MAKKWTKFPHADKAFAYDAAGLKGWRTRLAQRDRRTFPQRTPASSTHGAISTPANLRKRSTGSGAGAGECCGQGPDVCTPTIPKAEKAKIELLEEAAAFADARRGKAPKDANAHYLYAFAIGRYGQGISVVKALGAGLQGGKIKEAVDSLR